MSSASTQPLVTSDDQGTVVSVVTWFLLVATTLMVIVRVATKLAVARKISGDDYMIFAALLFSIAQSVAVSLQRVGGLGRHIVTLTSSELDKYQKAGYAADLSFIPTLCFAKISVHFLLRSITPVAYQRKLVLTIGATTLVWAVISELVAAFQCHLLSTWRYIDNKCIDRVAFWNYFGVLNILTDFPLLVLPLIVIWGVNVDLKRKIIIFGCFAPRISVIAATIVQLIYLNRAANTSDFTFDHLPFVVCTQVVQNLSVITACIVYLKPFFESLESGMIRSDDLRRRGLKSTTGSNYTGSGGDMPTSKTKFALRSARDAVGESRELDGIGQRNHTTTVTAAGNLDNQYDWDAGSQKSQSRIITQTTTWAVDR
ncbi:hypothetical protein MMC16_000928 [Acarospora aff. strigata]|nr:hypothetical protein [Acarospora aff. strigata]